VQRIIVHWFTPMGQIQVRRALCVANRESHFDPNAQNPYSGAAGVYQFMPSVWPNLSRAAGWGGHSVFEATANVATAAWTVSHYGWSPWAGDGPACGF
jgi:soluble lytic murein transglycosylase-like protein